MKKLTALSFALALGLGCAAAPKIVPPAVDCGTRILNDAAQGMTLAQIVADAGAPCGVDLAAIVVAILQSQQPQVVASPAYGEATRLRDTVLAMPKSSAPPAPSVKDGGK